MLNSLFATTMLNLLRIPVGNSHSQNQRLVQDAIIERDMDEDEIADLHRQAINAMPIPCEMQED